MSGTATIVTSVFSLDNGFADSELWLVGGNGTTIIAYDDDGNPGGGSGGMSSLLQLSLAPPNYYLALSGFNDGGFFSTICQMDGTAVRRWSTAWHGPRREFHVQAPLWL